MQHFRNSRATASYLQPLHFPIQGGPVDGQYSGSLRFITASLLEGIKNLGFLIKDRLR